MTLSERRVLPFHVTRPQHSFISAPDRFPCLCAGFGSGKTVGGVVRALVLKAKYPKLDVGYYLPTKDLVKSVGYPAFMEVMDLMSLHGTIKKSDHAIEVRGAGRIIFRSMDDPALIVGYKHADAVVDELDTLPTNKARLVWNKIIARNRQKKPDSALNTVAAVSTPEGFRFMYERWHKSPAPGYRLIRASTFSNARNLPADYIPSLQDSYPTNLLQAYLEGLFVNLTAGCVYPEFHRDLNDTKVVAAPGEPLHVGMDFNVGNMSSVIHVQRDGEPHGIDELMKVLDTTTMIRMLQERWKGHPILVYPDASGKSRKSTNASESDLALLRQAQFQVCVNPANPAVKDRVISLNAMIHRDGKRGYRISQDRCPIAVESLEKQAYDSNGEPDKSSGHDHPPDAIGYYVSYRWPIRRPATVIKLGMAH
ncbi:MAG TPA: terminase family protein [Steroidobacter sp.]|uniref:phage terminase large subunit family protein n=1 Tax=Steroidobacter sp. TaxID=1978227 RepID=UPI002EDB3542